MTYFTADARDAGRNVVHTVRDSAGNAVGTRRSAHVYRWAFVARGVVRRWSNNPAARGDETAVYVDYFPAPRAEPTRSKAVICGCGKTVKVDGFGAATGNVCPVCEVSR